MAKTFTVKVHPEQIGRLLKANSAIADDLMRIGNEVLAKAEATASDAENGPGGTVDGYAAAGFGVYLMDHPNRLQVIVASHADEETSRGAHFNSARKNGIPHLPKALIDVLGVTSKDAKQGYRYMNWKH